MITKEEFTELYHASITRRGADKLLDWMGKADFFTAPASTRYHLACKGGLMEHSVHVYRRLQKIVAAEYPEDCPYSDETLAVVGLLHDLCKTHFYGTSMRNVKNEETGVWEKKPYYIVDDKIPLGHGDKSVLLAGKYIELSCQELYAIWHHMGYSGQDYSAAQAIDHSILKYPMVLALQTADMMASKLLEGDDSNRFESTATSVE